MEKTKHIQNHGDSSDCAVDPFNARRWHCPLIWGECLQNAQPKYLRINLLSKLSVKQPFFQLYHWHDTHHIHPEWRSTVKACPSVEWFHVLNLTVTPSFQLHSLSNFKTVNRNVLPYNLISTRVSQTRHFRSHTRHHGSRYESLLQKCGVAIYCYNKQSQANNQLSHVATNCHMLHLTVTVHTQLLQTTIDFSVL